LTVAYVLLSLFGFMDPTNRDLSWANQVVTRPPAPVVMIDEPGVESQFCSSVVSPLADHYALERPHMLQPLTLRVAHQRA